MRRGVERTVSVIVSGALVIGMLLAFSPSVKQVEASLDSSLEHFAKVKPAHLSLSI
jgi:hypothetical protein